MLVGRPVLELDQHPPVAPRRLLQPAGPAVHLAANQQPQARVARANEGLDYLGKRLALAHEAARDVEADQIIGAAGGTNLVGDPDQLRVTAPAEQGAVDAQRAVALPLGAGEGVDDVVGRSCRHRVLGRERFPDEAADRPHALATQAGDLGELVVLVA